MSVPSCIRMHAVCYTTDVSCVSIKIYYYDSLNINISYYEIIEFRVLTSVTCPARPKFNDFAGPWEGRSSSLI